MAEYTVFIWGDEQAWERAGAGAMQENLAAHREFMARHGAALRGGNRLHPSSVSTSIRHTVDGGVSVSDGAFAETKEVIGGYYLIEAADLDEALRIAAEVPAPFGGVEVRPVWPAD
ncbi:MAG: transcription initiation protein [Streptosporangiaceae bacterium]|nr:transcription initiation protein [Streptosporangiaceae bacterium]MBV9856531.1 transcription initiation protein [Streptosporangiaceae bacterium]